MGLLSWLGGGNDRQLADTQYPSRESASEKASRQRRERHRARVFRDGDAAGMKMPRRYRKHNG